MVGGAVVIYSKVCSIELVECALRHTRLAIWLPLPPAVQHLNVKSASQALPPKFAVVAFIRVAVLVSGPKAFNAVLFSCLVIN